MKVSPELRFILVFCLLQLTQNDENRPFLSSLLYVCVISAFLYETSQIPADFTKYSTLLEDNIFTVYVALLDRLAVYRD